METYINYQGYGIIYYSMLGKVVIDNLGFPLKTFLNVTEIEGIEKAKKTYKRSY